MRLSYHYRIAFLPLLLLASCSLSPSTSGLKEIEDGFVHNRGTYAALRDMIVEDALSELRIGARVDRINKYYHTSGGWFDDHNERIDFPDVLRDSGITQERYDCYKELMNIVGITQMSADAEDVSFLVEAFGHLDDGYVIEIVNTPADVSEKTISSVNDIPTKEEGEYFVSLEGCWYLRYSLSY